MLELLAKTLTRKGEEHYVKEREGSLESYGILTCITDVKVVSIDINLVCYEHRNAFRVNSTSAHQKSLPCFQYRVPLAHSCGSWLRGYTAGRHPRAE